MNVNASYRDKKSCKTNIEQLQQTRIIFCNSQVIKQSKSFKSILRTMFKEKQILLLQPLCAFLMSGINLNAIKTKPFSSTNNRVCLFISIPETASKKHTLKIMRRMNQMHKSKFLTRKKTKTQSHKYSCLAHSFKIQGYT